MGKSYDHLYPSKALLSTDEAVAARPLSTYRLTPAVTDSHRQSQTNRLTPAG